MRTGYPARVNSLLPSSDVDEDNAVSAQTKEDIVVAEMGHFTRACGRSMFQCHAVDFFSSQLDQRPVF
jgi:hypothetical protein